VERADQRGGLAQNIVSWRYLGSLGQGGQPPALSLRLLAESMQIIRCAGDDSFE
jgi:hypothetical protein